MTVSDEKLNLTKILGSIPLSCERVTVHYGSRKK